MFMAVQLFAHQGNSRVALLLARSCGLEVLRTQHFCPTAAAFHSDRKHVGKQRDLWAPLECSLQDVRVVDVPSCGQESCKLSDSTWCNFRVSVPQRDWNKILSVEPKRLEPSFTGRSMLRTLDLPGDLKIVEVMTEKQLCKALPWLQASMLDKAVAIDLEWSQRQKNVDLIQLASSSFCLLIRIRGGLKKSCPDELDEFFR